ncbi:hypothetical protein [Sphingobacterium detergens]|uniref:hypothetical protein n=1 Tax=Sphingobacterium detergens TaxID=1145106 RepID=UPI003AAEF106
MKELIIIAIIIFNAINGYAQSFRVKELNQKAISNYRNKSLYLAEYNRYLSNAYSIEKELSIQYKKNSVEDFTDLIQSALDKHNVVVLPNFPIVISDKGLALNNNQVLLFQTNSILKLKPSAKNSYSILSLTNISNVKIFFANIEGDRYEHIGKGGQWGFGIGIKSSNNIYLYSPFIERTWGDGIYIGQLRNEPSENIYIYNSVINEVRRNGVSITSGRNISILNTYIANTNGNSPESGIDLEPNSINDIIENINIKNLTTFNNKWAGMLMVFEKFKSNRNKIVSVNIDGHKDVGSKNAIAFHGYRNDKSANNLSGTINLKNTDYSTDSKRVFFYQTNLSRLNINTSDKNLKSRFNSFTKK